jgi:hypothetical protein
MKTRMTTISWFVASNRRIGSATAYRRCASANLWRVLLFMFVTLDPPGDRYAPLAASALLLGLKELGDRLHLITIQVLDHPVHDRRST